ncbi:MAG: cytochrome c3 family protein [Woeseiaceae bacterium]|nr:cytochrome c3 family protein [Woeseiaceae bacterium]
MRSHLAAVALMLAAMLAADTVLANSLEKLVMPGRVIEGHADTEAECGACHDDNSDAATATLCTACHEDVGADRLAQTGFHGRMPAARTTECVACHTDHEGRDADIVDINAGLFDHDFTDFLLTNAHAAARCDACHAPGDSYHEAPTECIDCHRDEDVHKGSLGPDCASCHGTSDWPTFEFDHATTGYRLTGAHATVVCADCHRNNSYDNTPRSCGSCHDIDDVHGGANGPACGDCHSTSTWRSIGFDHAAETGFPLVEGHGGLACNDCHRREDFTDDFSAGCIACHAPDDFHQGRNGKDCGSCHRPSEWRFADFDHDTTGFRLVEAHAELECTACHKQQVDLPLASDCGSCHAFDDAHGGQLGSACASCHTQSDWHESIAFDHDLSSFPLTGLHAAVSCGGCHASPRFADAGTECAACHVEDDVHGGTLGDNCGSCHTSNGWTTTVFDHDLHTNFPLDGGHAGLSCNSCHRDAEASADDVPSTCGGCHATDDVHEGQFGSQCGSCHSTSSFLDVQTLGNRRK